MDKIGKLISKHFKTQITNNYIKNIIGYGSGVFVQSNTNKNNQSLNQIDIIITVNQSSKFHKINYQQNLKDYKGLVKIFGPNYLNLLHKYVFPWHSNHIQIQSLRIKYNVVEEALLIKDLHQWSILSLAGRFHKPMHFFIQTNQNLDKAININYQSALNVAILLLYRKHMQPIPLQQLFIKICMLSYMGDIRNYLKIENHKKVENIVKGSYLLLQTIYLPRLHKLKKILPQNIKQTNLQTITINYDPKLIHYLVHNLPDSIKKQLILQIGQKSNKTVVQQILLGGLGQSVKLIQSIIKKKNFRNSIWMALENFLGSSLTENIAYLLLKLSKKQNK